jgi:hypothetical protein
MTVPRPLIATLEACIRFQGIGKPATLVAGAGHSTTVYGRVGPLAAPPCPPAVWADKTAITTPQAIEAAAVFWITRRV